MCFGCLKDRLLRARRGVLQHAGGEQVFRSFDLELNVVRKKIRGADVLAQRIRVVPELLVRLRQSKPRLCELQVDLNCFSEFDGRLGVPLLFELSVAVVEIFFLRDGRIFRAGNCAGECECHRKSDEIFCALHDVLLRVTRCPCDQINAKTKGMIRMIPGSEWSGIS